MPDYDVFVSYAHADAAAVAPLVAALRDGGLAVWQDASDIPPFESITDRIVGGLGSAKAMLAWYSATYPRVGAGGTGDGAAQQVAGFVEQVDGHPGGRHPSGCDQRDARERRCRIQRQRQRADLGGVPPAGERVVRLAGEVAHPICAW